MSSMSPVRVGTPLQAAAPRTHGRSLLPLSWGGACARPRRISKSPRRRSLEALEGVHPTRHHQRRLLTCPGVVSCCHSGAGLTARKKASCAPATSSSVQASDPRPPEPPGGQDLSARRRAVLAARQEATPGTPRDPRVPREAARHPQGRSPGSWPALTGCTHAPGVSTNPTAKPEATEGESARSSTASQALRCPVQARPPRRPSPCGSTYLHHVHRGPGGPQRAAAEPHTLATPRNRHSASRARFHPGVLTQGAVHSCTPSLSVGPSREPAMAGPSRRGSVGSRRPPCPGL